MPLLHIGYRRLQQRLYLRRIRRLRLLGKGAGFLRVQKLFYHEISLPVKMFVIRDQVKLHH